MEHGKSAKGPNPSATATPIATCAFDRLTEEQTATMATASDPAEKVEALIHTYIDMSTRYPGHAAVLFRWDLVDHHNPAYAKAARASFDLLVNAVAAAVPPGTPTDTTRHAAKCIWAMAHGFVTLSMTDGAEAEARITFAVQTLLAGMQP